MKPVNLLPTDLRSGATGPVSAASTGTTPSGGIGAYIVLGVLAFCVVALAGYVLAGNVVKDRKAELARMTAESAAVSRQAAALKPYADFETLAHARVQTVRDLASSRFDWEQALRDLSRVVPADVTLASLKGDLGGGAAASGGGSSSGGSSSGGGIRGAITAPAITLNGCTRSQTEVARLMARLRMIDGVTRVSLSQSNKADAASSAGGTTGSPATTGGCGKPDAPTFEIVVFFEGATTASQAPTPGASGAATTTSVPGVAPAKAAASATPAPTPQQAGATTPTFATNP